MASVRYEIENRHGLKIVVLFESVAQSQGLAIVLHGLGGFKEQRHIIAIAEGFSKAGYSVVRFDATNSIGESGGTMEDSTTTSYLEDLEDVIQWAKEQPWWQESLILSGHSQGAFAVILYAEDHPDEVKALAPFSTVVSGKLSLESPAYSPHVVQEWKARGYREEWSKSKPGVLKRLKWSHLEDRLKYDVLPRAGRLTMPVLLVVGEDDDSTPIPHVQLLYDALPGPKKLHMVKNAPHTFWRPRHLREIRDVLVAWLKTLA